MSRATARPTIPVSWGELLDKITILRIKRDRLEARAARANVEKELGCLLKVAGQTIALPGVSELLAKLQAVNEDLWEIEDAIRQREAKASFGQEFVKLARLVYMRNDLRAAIKRDLNLLLASELIEEKSYAGAVSGRVSSPAPPS
jgi:hypothetical protein